jgi:hypothetical protein
MEVDAGWMDVDRDRENETDLQELGFVSHWFRSSGALASCMLINPHSTNILQSPATKPTHNQSCDNIVRQLVRL